jgi:hypothetical protein
MSSLTSSTHDSSVGIATKIWARLTMNRGSIPCRGNRYFSFPRPTQPPIHYVPGTVSREWNAGAWSQPLTSVWWVPSLEIELYFHFTSILMACYQSRELHNLYEFSDAMIVGTINLRHCGGRWSRPILRQYPSNYLRGTMRSMQTSGRASGLERWCLWPVISRPVQWIQTGYPGIQVSDIYSNLTCKSHLDSV